MPVKFILQLLTAELKIHCYLSLASDLLECAEPDENFYRNFITVDVTWVCGCGCHSEKYLQHHDQSKCIKVDAKSMLTGFMDDAVIVHSADAAQGKTGNHHFYVAGVRCL